MHIKALTAVALAVVFSAVVFHTTHASALSQTTTTNTNAAANAAPEPAADPTVTVQPGDSLSKIATGNNTTYVRIFDANEAVQDPDVIYPGQVLNIPDADEQLPDRMAAAPPAPVATTTTYTPRATRTTHVVADSTAPSAGVWAAIASCESGGNWSINTGNGYYGGLQFTLSSWRGVGGSGLPSDASAAEQISRAQILQSRSGWGNWPVCARKAGVY